MRKKEEKKRKRKRKKEEKKKKIQVLNFCLEFMFGISLFVWKSLFV